MTKMNLLSVATFRVAPQSRRDLEATAERYLQQIAPENLRTPTRLDVLALLDSLEHHQKIGFGVEDLGSGEEGYTDWEHREIILDTKVYIALVAGDPRARQTGCHEVGHIDHIDQVRRRIRDGGPQLARHFNKEVPIYCNPEWQAKGIGAALLMPRWTTVQVYREGGVPALVEQFQVSWLSARVRVERLRDLGMLGVGE